MSEPRAALRRLWPRRLAGQLIALLLLALVLAQAAAFVIFTGERREAVRSEQRGQILERTASILRLLEQTPPVLHEQIVATGSSRALRFWLSEAPVAHAGGSELSAQLRERLETLLGDDELQAMRVELDDDRPAKDSDGGDAQSARDASPEGWLRRAEIVISARLRDGRWLNVGVDLERPLLWRLPSLVPLGLTALVLSAVVIFMVRRITQPLGRLAAAAERVGRGEAVEPLPEQGPLDVRQATLAFNRMHQRLRRFVEDRTRMLAAISHDLRTPITSLRLRAEFVEDGETRERILETLDEMECMTEATLAFAREEAAREDTRMVDLAALVESLCQDLADLGLDVTFEEPDAKAPLACRPVSLKRALRNLIENACAYGRRARVALEASSDELRVVVDDDGPGIADADHERVFAPFVRLEASRARETGGIGLGLAIARSIVRGHGGDITLANRTPSGLRVTIRLPRSITI